MFGLFKKELLNREQRFNNILTSLETDISKTIKRTTGDLRFLESGINENTSPDVINGLISQIITQKIGFAILSLNIGLRNIENHRLLIYDALSIWEKNIKNKSIKICSFISIELQQEIYDRFLIYQTDLQFGYTGNKSIIQFFENAFRTEAIWYAEHNMLGSTDKFIRLTKDEFLNTFSFFDRHFSKYKHI